LAFWRVFGVGGYTAFGMRQDVHAIFVNWVQFVAVLPCFAYLTAVDPFVRGA
jgi:hypothetical protein